jgi:pyruvate formate-lyase activating enzyme-like uncharacterized protein
MLLVNRQDFKDYNRQVSNSLHNDVLNMHISDAQLQDLKPLLGERLYNKIMLNPENYTELINGGTYECGNVTYTNVGLKAVIVYFAYARFMYYGSEINTAFATVSKNENNSTKSSLEIRKQFYNSNKKSASYMWDNVRDFLIRTNVDDFFCFNNKRVNTFNIYKIGE